MRTVDEFMKLPYKMEIVSDTKEGGYAISFTDLSGAYLWVTQLRKLCEVC